MKKIATLSILALPFLSVPAAQAAPVMPGAAPRAMIDGQNTVEQAQYRYHRNCGWRGGRWVVDLGAGKLVVCRPNRPGRNYIWREEGKRRGWYNPRQRQWHFHNW